MMKSRDGPTLADIPQTPSYLNKGPNVEMIFPLVFLVILDCNKQDKINKYFSSYEETQRKEIWNLKENETYLLIHSKPVCELN